MICTAYWEIMVGNVNFSILKFLWHKIFVFNGYGWIIFFRNAIKISCIMAFNLPHFSSSHLSPFQWHQLQLQSSTDKGRQPNPSSFVYCCPPVVPLWIYVTDNASRLCVCEEEMAGASTNHHHLITHSQDYNNTKSCDYESHDKQHLVLL